MSEAEAGAAGHLRTSGITGVTLALMQSLPRSMERLCDCIVSSGTDGVVRVHDVLIGKAIASL